MPHSARYGLILSLFLAIGGASADIIVDGQSIPSVDIQSITINPDTGNVTVVTEPPGYNVSKNVNPGQVAITNFNASPSNLVEGESTTISWNTENAVSCAATGGTGGWSGSAIELPSGSTSIPVANAGSYTFTLTCDGSDAGDQTSANVVVTANAANAVAILGFTANPNPINEGDSTTLSWNTQNAVSCTATGGTGGWAGSAISLPSGNQAVTIDTAGNYTFTLTCEGADPADTDSASVTVTANSGNANCSASPLGNGVNKTWADYWGTSFPGPGYKTITTVLPFSSYLSIQFNTGNVVDNGKVITIETTQTSGARLGVISQCPGDFTATDDRCWRVWGIGGYLRWATDGYSLACPLQPNTTYYLNLTYTDGFDPASSDCDAAPCVVNVQHRN